MSFGLDRNQIGTLLLLLFVISYNAVSYMNFQKNSSHLAESEAQLAEVRNLASQIDFLSRKISSQNEGVSVQTNEATVENWITASGLSGFIDVMDRQSSGEIQIQTRMVRFHAAGKFLYFVEKNGSMEQTQFEVIATEKPGFVVLTVKMQLDE